MGEIYDRIRKPITSAQILQNLKDIQRYKEERGVKRPVIKIQGIWPAIRADANLYYDTFAPHVDLVAFNPLIDYLQGGAWACAANARAARRAANPQ